MAAFFIAHTILFYTTRSRNSIRKIFSLSQIVMLLRMYSEDFKNV